ncbi:MAG TPA: hypothetical protein VIH28_07070 [Ignavibacteriaceae bacterium]
MKATDVKIGTIFLFTPTGKEFEVVKVTEKRISWNVPTHNLGRNTMSMAWTSVKQFQHGLDSGAYKLIENKTT